MCQSYQEHFLYWLTSNNLHMKAQRRLWLGKSKACLINKGLVENFNYFRKRDRRSSLFLFALLHVQNIKWHKELKDFNFFCSQLIKKMSDVSGFRTSRASSLSIFSGLGTSRQVLNSCASIELQYFLFGWNFSASVASESCQQFNVDELSDHQLYK